MGGRSVERNARHSNDYFDCRSEPGIGRYSTSPCGRGSRLLSAKPTVKIKLIQASAPHLAAGR